MKSSREIIEEAIAEDEDVSTGESASVEGGRIDDGLAAQLNDAGIAYSENADGSVSFLFSYNYNPRAYDSSVIPKSDEQRKSDEIEQEDVQLVDGEDGRAENNGSASVPVAEDAAFPGVQAAAQQCAASFQQCQAKNPYACRFHGSKLMEGDLNAELGKAGVQNAQVTIQPANKNGITFEALVKCPRKNAKAGAKALLAFSKRPGITGGSFSDFGYDPSSKAFEAIYDVDALARAATSNATAHAPKPAAKKKPARKIYTTPIGAPQSPSASANPTVPASGSQTPAPTTPSTAPTQAQPSAQPVSLPKAASSTTQNKAGPTSVHTQVPSSPKPTQGQPQANPQTPTAPQQPQTPQQTQAKTKTQQAQSVQPAPVGVSPVSSQASVTALNGILGKVKNSSGIFGRVVGAFLPAEPQPGTQASAPNPQKQTKATSAQQSTPPGFGPNPSLPNDDSSFPEIGNGPNDIDFSKFSTWKQIGSGSTLPRKVTIGNTAYFVKKAGENPHYTVAAAENEVNANRFIRLAGFNAPESRLYQDANGDVYCVTKEEKAVGKGNTLSGNLGNRQTAEETVSAYPIMDLMYNTDILENADNSFVDSDGHPIFLDNGSTFGFSAQGDRDPKRKFGFDYDNRTDPLGQNGMTALVDFGSTGSGNWARAFQIAHGGFSRQAVLSEASKYHMVDLVNEAIKQGLIPKVAQYAISQYAANMEKLAKQNASV